MKRALALLAAGGLTAAGLAGCTALAPPARTEISLAPGPAGNSTIEPIDPVSGQPQHFTPGAPVPADWWRGLVPEELVRRALAANTDLAIADANLRQARGLAGAAAAAQFPQIDASFQSQRTRIAGNGAALLSDPNATLYSLHTAQVTVAYPLDLFGGVATKVRSSRFAAEGAALRASAARTTVLANLVLAVVQHASLVQQIAAAREAVTANQQVLVLLRRRRELGALGAADVSAQEAALATAEAALPGLERARLRQRAIISVLIGQAPGTDLPPLPASSEMVLPRELPMITLQPARRGYSSAAMQGAAMDVGTAIAARLPAINLTANAGGTATSLSDLFVPGNLFWQMASTATQPLLHGGALLNQQRAARAAFDAAKAQYRAAVLQAFADVSDALAALHADGQVLDADARADDAAARTLANVTRQLELGAVGRAELLGALSARANAAGALAQARAARYADTVALYQALGGGVIPPEPSH